MTLRWRKLIGPLDDRVDELYGEVFHFAMKRLATTDGLDAG